MISSANRPNMRPDIRVILSSGCRSVSDAQRSCLGACVLMKTECPAFASFCARVDPIFPAPMIPILMCVRLSVLCGNLLSGRLTSSVNRAPILARRFDGSVGWQIAALRVFLGQLCCDYLTRTSFEYEVPPEA